MARPARTLSWVGVVAKPLSAPLTRFIATLTDAFQMKDTVTATIDLQAIRHNLAVVRALCPSSRIMAMVKCDAYGHGILPVARTLSDAEGLAVARLKDALTLRASGIEQRILLLGTLLDSGELATCSKLDIDVTAHDRGSLDAIEYQARSTPLRVWLELDSGMHRLGLDPEAFVAASRALSHHPGVRELVHMSHLSNADDIGAAITTGQLSMVEAFRSGSDGPKALSIANSAALISLRESHAEWVRPGIALYGDNPISGQIPLALRAAMTLRSRILAVRDVKAGESVGYGRTWTAERRTSIATVGAGYGDGYPRHAGNGTPVWVNGAYASLAGRVSMDSLMIDCGESAGARVGDEVILWGPEVPVGSVARCATTISYELMTSAGRRVHREYVGGAAAVMQQQTSTECAETTE
jgi:alanine racemase